MKRNVPAWLVVAIAIVIVAAVGYVAGIRPKRAEITKVDEQITALQVQVEAAQQLADQAGEDEAAAAIRVADLVKLAKAMPDELDMPGIILELNAAATAAGVEFSAIAPGTPAAGNGYTVIPITLSFQGTYYELTQLLFSLRNLVTVRDGVLDANGRLFTIDGLNLQEGVAGFPHVEALLTVSAYQYGIDASVSLPAGVDGVAPPASTTGETGETSTTSTDTTETTPGATSTTPAPPTDTEQAPPAAVGDGAQQAEGVTP